MYSNNTDTQFETAQTQGLSPLDWQVMDNDEQVAQSAYETILDIAQRSIEQRGLFSLVLAGGTTPERVYALLADSDKVSDWDKWQLYIGDERCLPPENPERNSQMVHRILLDKVPIDSQNVHFISAEKGPVEGARGYVKYVKEALPFDLVLLGMGEDGHTASLFPGHEHNDAELVHAVFDAPKPPPQRVSLSVRALSSNRRLLILVTGAGKRSAMKQWLAGKSLPVSRIGTLGKGQVLLDRAACPDEYDVVIK